MNELFNVKGKVVVITGGAGILGKGIAAYLAKEGAKVVVLDRSEEAGKALVDSIKAEGNEAMFLYTDVMDKEVLEGNKIEIMKAYGRIDVLLNAAGGNMAGATIAPDKTFFDLQIDAFKKVVDLNLFRYSIAYNGICRNYGGTEERFYCKLLFRIGSSSIDPCGRLWCGKSSHCQLY